MAKLFEMPVYAMNRKDLHGKYKEFCTQLRNEHAECTEDHICAVAELETYPYRLWDYNHIVGYIRISTNGRDILFDVFLPTPYKERYWWRGGRKTFLYNISANGTHFYVSDKMHNTEIQTRIAEMFRSVIKAHIPKRYYVDTETFDHLNKNLDYVSIMEEAQNGQNEI